MNRAGASQPGYRTFPAPPVIVSEAETMTATCCYVVPVAGERLEQVIRAAVRENGELAMSSLNPDDARIVRRSFGHYGYVWIGLELCSIDDDATVIAARSKSAIDLSGGVGQLTALMTSIRIEVSNALS